MLRVIAELDYVIRAVFALDQMGLSAASHFPNEAARIYGHKRKGQSRFLADMTFRD